MYAAEGSSTSVIVVIWVALTDIKNQRFGHSEAVSEKLEGRVNFPLSINMLPYTTKPNSQKVPKSKYMYDLSTAVIHKGQLDTGHYYAYCRQGEQVGYRP